MVFKWSWEFPSRSLLTTPCFFWLIPIWIRTNKCCFGWKWMLFCPFQQVKMVWGGFSGKIVDFHRLKRLWKSVAGAVVAVDHCYGWGVENCSFDPPLALWYLIYQDCMALTIMVMVHGGRCKIARSLMGFLMYIGIMLRLLVCRHCRLFGNHFIIIKIHIWIISD